MSGDDDLIDDWLDGEPSAEDAARLSAILVGDPAAADRLATAARLDERLRSIAADARVPARLPRARRIVAALATAAAIVAALTWWWPRDARAIVTDGAGATRGGVAIAAGDRIAAGETVTAAADGWLHLRWPDGTIADVGGGGRLTIASARALAFAAGELRVEAAHRAPGAALTVTTPHAVVSVVGTRFAVAVDATGTRVRVDSGVVRFAPRDGDARDVAAGASAEATAGPIGFVTGERLGTLITGGVASYWQGFRFVVGDRPLVVTALGRWATRGNARVHPLELIDAETRLAVPGGAVDVDLAGAPPGAFRYAALARPATLAAHHEYLLLSHEVEGADLSWDKDTSVTTTDAARVLGGALRTEDGEYWSMGGAGNTWGPVDFRYEPDGG